MCIRDRYKSTEQYKIIVNISSLKSIVNSWFAGRCRLYTRQSIRTVSLQWGKLLKRSLCKQNSLERAIIFSRKYVWNNFSRDLLVPLRKYSWNNFLRDILVPLRKYSWNKFLRSSCD